MIVASQQPCDEGVIRGKTFAEPCPKFSGRWILAATILASSMVFIDGTVINVALPALQVSLDATVLDVQWVIESYSLLLAALLLVGGSLGDYYGRRRIFLIGVIMFAVASVWCGCVSNISQLIIARTLQGLGAALLVPGSLAIISASFPERDRGHAIGTWSAFTAITAAVGPVLGGWLIEHISWRAIFFINLPLALLVLMISFRYVPESRDENAVGKLDWLGGAFTVIGLGSTVYGLLESSRRGLQASRNPDRSRKWNSFPDHLSFLGSTYAESNVAAASVSFARLHGRQFAYVLSLQRAWRHAFFPAVKLDSSPSL